MPNRLRSDSDEALSAQLCYVLAMLAKGRALDIMQNPGPGEGVEAFRKLEETYHPKLASRFAGSLSLILTTKFGPDIESELECLKRISEVTKPNLVRPWMMNSFSVCLLLGCKTHHEGPRDTEFKTVEHLPLCS